MKQIPVVVIHLEDKAYINNFVKLNTMHNILYFIGDETTEHYETSYKNVIHIHKKILETDKNMEIIKQYQDPNPKITKHESYLIYLSYLRWFYLQTFMKMYDFDKIFHIDSDCILTLNVNDFKFTKDNAFNVNSNYDNPLRMSCAIHNALFTKKFIDDYIKLFEDIFINKSKFHLIAEKCEKCPFICDMTLAYLLSDDIQDLKRPVDGAVFNHIMMGSEGFESKHQYKMAANGILEIYKDQSNQFYVFDKINNCYYKLNSLHFQGPAKRILLDFDSWKRSLSFIT